MHNTFFSDLKDSDYLSYRLNQLESGKVGFYSIGLYPASLAYNSAMQTQGSDLLLAPRPGRQLLGAFPSEIIQGMDHNHVLTMRNMGQHNDGSKSISNTLADLIERCELVVLSANSNHIEEDLLEAKMLRDQMNRKEVVLACLSGSFSHSDQDNKSYVLCENDIELGFFSGFHRHAALRNPLDSFTANFCHPDALTAMVGAKLLNKLSPNIQVSPGVHNVEAQYIKAAKNVASIFAGFAHTYHRNNPGLLPTILTLLLDQCLDQAATVSMSRKDRNKLYNSQAFPLTELGYGVQRIEAALLKDGDMKQVRDHTFTQLTAMVADVRGSMMKPNIGSPTRNFQAGEILAENMTEYKRCPKSIEEFIQWCIDKGLSKGSLEGLNSLKYWKQIVENYSIPLNDSSMINLLYMSLYGVDEIKGSVFNVMTNSRQLSSYCQESVRPKHSRLYDAAFSNLENENSQNLIISAINKGSNYTKGLALNSSPVDKSSPEMPDFLRTMRYIEDFMVKSF